MTPSFLHSCIAWLRRNLHRNELLSAAVALAAAAVLWWYGDQLALPYQLGLGAVALVALAVLLRLAGPRVLGPVFAYDLVRTSRHSRYFLLRGGYAGVLLLALFLLYASWFGGSTLDDLLAKGSVASDKITRFAESFFSVFLSVQMAAVFLLTPAFAAGAIAEEKEHRTLDYLLTSDLSNREIVLGKLTARLAVLALVLVAGLPVLSFVQFLGGVDPNLVLAGFAATGITMVSVASLGLVNSIYVSTSRSAIFLTYLESAGYLLGSTLCLPFAGAPPPFSWPAAGNIFVAMYQLSDAAAAGSLATVLPGVLRDYVLFHIAVTVTCVVWGSYHLRRETRAQAGQDVSLISVAAPHGGRYVITRPPPFEPIYQPRPPLAEEPLLWRELHVEPGFRLPPVVMGIAIFVVVNALCGAAAIFLGGVLLTAGVGNGLTEFSNGWTRIVGLPVACLMLLAVAVRAASAISVERDRQTLDSLLTTPLDNREILWGKWWASILSVRKGWWVLGTIWVLGLLTGGVHPLALPLMVGAWFIFAAFLAGLGLWFSLVSRTTLRATVWTLLTIVVVCFGHWALGGLCCGPFLLGGSMGTRWLTNFHWYGLTPPATLDALTFSWFSISEERSGSAWPLLSAVVGLMCYSAAALLLWYVLNARFGRITGRISVGIRGEEAELSDD